MAVAVAVSLGHGQVGDLHLQAVVQSDLIVVHLRPGDIDDGRIGSLERGEEDRINLHLIQVEADRIGIVVVVEEVSPHAQAG